MIDKAILKLTEEMNNDKSAYVTAVGDKLIQLCDNNEYVAGKIMQEGKTIKGAMDKMMSIASKRQSNRQAAIDPAEGYNIIMEYYGIENVSTDIQFHQKSRSEYIKQPEGKLIDIMDLL